MLGKPRRSAGLPYVEPSQKSGCVRDDTNPQPARDRYIQVEFRIELRTIGDGQE